MNQPANDDVLKSLLTPDDYKEFRSIIKEEYGVDLSEDESIVMAKRLLSLYELIARPLPNETAAKVPLRS